MKIPKKFNLLGLEIKVEIRDDLVDELSRWGQACYRRDKIEMANQGKHGINKQAMEQTFIHELTHFILYYAGEKELSENEEKVDLIAGLLHQAFTSMEGDLNKDN